MNTFVIPAKAGIQVSLLSCFVAFLFLCSAASAATPAELQSAIEEKNKALQAISLELQAKRQDLIETEERSKNLNQELSRINYSLNQVNLGIRSSELTIDKLGLEIDGLEGDIADTTAARDAKQSAVQDILRAMQQKDGESALLSFLKNRSLAASLLELQTLHSLNNGLGSEAAALASLQSDLEHKLAEQNNKKRSAEEERRSLSAKKASAEEQKADRQTLLKETKNQQKLYQQTIDALEERQQAVSDEIESIETLLRQKIDPALLPTSRHGVLELPVKNARVSQNFGATAFAKQAGYVGKFHNGIDIAAPIGTPIYAAEDGTVAETGNQDKFCRKGAYGRFIVINHNNNLTTLYGHLSLVEPSIIKGKTVKRGELIGYVGKTGYATGPHLHFTVYASPTFYMGKSRSCGPMPYGGYLNPADYL